MPDIDHEVLIVGGGPTGLMLAGELSLAGIDAVIVERRPDQSVDGSRAGGLHARTLEVLDQRGIVERFLAEGKTAQVAGFAWNPIDISDFPTRHPYGLALWQRHIERILADWVKERGIKILRDVEAVSAQDAGESASIELNDGRTLRASYVVGCDGGRSLLRKAAGIAFIGTDPSISHIIAEAKLAQDPPWGMKRDSIGVHGLSRLPESGLVRIMLTEREVKSGDLGESELRAALVDTFGSDFGLSYVSWVSRFTDAARQAETYRKGRLLIAGDAAHIHYPVGGQGLNLGVQDAVNLGWKLAQVVRGQSPDTLLDSYTAERHPIAARVLQSTLAQVAILRGNDAHAEALRASIADLVKLDEARRMLGGMMSGLDIRYPLGAGHPLVGRRMPDLDLVTAAGPLRVFHTLHAARPILFDLAGDALPQASAWADRVQLVRATYTGDWILPVIGTVDAPRAVLVRPDGYVAWAGGDGLEAALARWFGTATTG